MKLNFSVPVIALLAGAALGFCLRGNSNAADTAAPNGAEPDAHKPRQVADVGADASAEALRRRVRELEGLLAEANAAAATNAVAVEGERRRPERFNRREWMERIKTEDPERYAQMTNQWANFRAMRREQSLSKLDFFAAIDLSELGEEAQQTHSRLQSIIAKREELEQKLQDESLPEEEFGSIMRELRSTMPELYELCNDERKNLIAETVKELGFSGDDAEAVISTFADILDATEANGFGPPPGPGGRGRGRGRRW